MMSKGTVKAKKHLGQNFLHDPGILDKIRNHLKGLNLSGWMEIGCGTGAITESLSNGDFPFLGVEVDRDLIPALTPLFARADQRLLHLSILGLEEDKVLELLPRRYGIFGNLPYNITSPIFERILGHYSHWKFMVCMVQKEVGNRLLATPGGRQISRLTIFCSYYAKVRSVLHVKRGCFTPAPAVDSMLISMERKVPALSRELEAVFFNLIRLGYSQRRKKCFKLLKSCYPEEKLKIGFGEAGIDLHVRAEEMFLDQWVALAKRVGEETKGIDEET